MRLYIVEDSEAVMERYLRQVGALEDVVVVGVSTTAEAAVRDLPVQQPDVVILDFHLADGNCLRVLDEMRPVLPGTTFIVATADPSDHHLERCLAAGAHFFFDKAGESAELFALIAVLAGGTKRRRSGSNVVLESKSQNE